MTPAIGQVPGFVVGAVLVAALMHATWNAMVKSRGEPHLAAALVATGGGLISAFALPFVDPPEPASWPFIAASGFVHVIYYGLLIETYRTGDMSHAYPLMRGSAPLMVALASGPLMGERLDPMQWAAVLFICGGILGLYASARDTGNDARRTTLFALLTACVIAGYTMIDGAGVRRSGAPAGYTMWGFVLTAVGVLGWGLWQRPGELARFARRNPHILLVGGVTTLGSYWIVLWAMTLAPVAAIAALRETSILFATGIAVVVLRERVGVARLAAVALVGCGAVAMRLG